MSQQHRIEHITDLLQFDPQTLERMLPDLIAWHAFTRQIIQSVAPLNEAQGGPSHLVRAKSFTWVDDGKPGKLDHVRLFNL